jgi:ubiquinone/menaquinone biosynthesis C-methylase UbiE
MAAYWDRAEVRFEAPNGALGSIQQMDAESLKFDDNTFDRVLSFNTFEHFRRPDTVLCEIHRVLKPGGSVLINFEGKWSSSFGYHLLQFGERIDRLVPAWGHLFLSASQMSEALAACWPSDAPLSVSEAVDFVYRSDELNRARHP